MTPDEVTLSRKSANVAGLLNLDARIDFSNAVVMATSIDEVPEPYRSWIKDPDQIPTDARRTPLTDLT